MTHVLLIHLLSELEKLQLPPTNTFSSPQHSHVMTISTNGFKAAQNGRMIGKSSSQSLVSSVCFRLHLPSALQLPTPAAIVRNWNDDNGKKFFFSQLSRP